MRRNVWTVLLVFVALLAGYCVGFHNGHKRARTGGVVFAVDSLDIARLSSTKAGFEPYFTRGNPIPADPN